MEIRKVTTLEKQGTNCKLIASFVQDTNERGVTTYYLQEYEFYDILNFNHTNYTDFIYDKDLGNKKFIEYIKDGYKVVSRDEFTPTKMDVDGNYLN